MPSPKRSSKIGFGFGVILVFGFPFAARYVPMLHAGLVYAVGIGTLLCLPFVFAKVRKSAVPAKPSDFIGYVFILMFVLAIGGVAYGVLK